MQSFSKLLVINTEAVRERTEFKHVFYSYKREAWEGCVVRDGIAHAATSKINAYDCAQKLNQRCSLRGVTLPNPEVGLPPSSVHKQIPVTDIVL